MVKNNCVVYYSCCLLFFLSLFMGCIPASLLTKSANLILPEQKDCKNPDIITAIKKRDDYLMSLKATAQIKVKPGKGRELAGRALIMLKRPDQLRVEVFGPANQTVALVVYNGGELSFLSFQENKLYKDYPFPMDVSKLPNYLLGLPVSGGQGPEGSGLYKKPDFYPDSCIYINSENEQISVTNEGTISDIMRQGDGNRQIQVTISSYKDINGFLFPFAISIDNGLANLSIKYRDVELNPDISDDSFSLPQMQGEEAIPIPAR